MDSILQVSTPVTIFIPYKLQREKEVIVLILQLLIHNLLASGHEGTECQDCLGVLRQYLVDLRSFQQVLYPLMQLLLVHVEMQIENVVGRREARSYLAHDKLQVSD